MPLSAKRKESFRKIVWDFYTVNSRDSLPWRKSITPYKVWVSEIMLQQTQVDRVIPFFNAWMKLFPNVTALANASQVDVLRAWKGLGYNSRALRMKKTAEMLIKNHKGVFPKKYEELLKLPGIGPYTAGAICAFAYNEPVTMIETNIRRVYLHHFFEHPQPPLKEEAPDTSSFRGGQGGVSIHDRELMLLIGETVDTQNPRQWYWALMDYGSYLAKTIPNPNKKSRHYAVQKKFKGSDREIRGKILEVLLSKRGMEIGVLLAKLADLSTDADRIELIISVMESEGFLFVKNGKISLVK